MPLWLETTTTAWRRAGRRRKEREREGWGVMQATPDWIPCRHFVRKTCRIILIGKAQISSFNVFWIIYEPEGRILRAEAIQSLLSPYSLIDLDKYKQRPPHLPLHPQCTRGHQTVAMSSIHSHISPFRSRKTWISVLNDKEMCSLTRCRASHGASGSHLK